jgi:acetyl-CoA carboxylase biotin carboxyl carrier protein
MPSKNPGGKEQSEHPWRLDEIQELINLLIEKEISEFELEKNGLKIRIKRSAAQSGSSAAAAQTAVLPLVPGPFPLPAAASAASSPAPEPAPLDSTEDLYVIKSPIVGTYYSASSPNAPPFVKVGDVVQVGQVLCIIEAMKLMNEIESEVAGTVARIYVENGQPVEYGQSLFALRPSRLKATGGG